MSDLSHAQSYPVQLSDVMFGGYMAFLLVGAAGTFYGPALIYIAAETNQPVAALGVLFVLHYSGYFGGTLGINRVSWRLGVRRALLLNFLLALAGALGLIVLPFPTNLAAAFFIGLAMGALDVLFNRTIEFLAVKEPAQALSRVHSTVGLGAVIIPLVVAAVGWLGWNWRIAGLVLVALTLVSLAIVWRWGELSVPHDEDVVWAAFPWRSILLFALLCLVYVGIETSVGGWATTFFAKLGEGPFLGAIATSLFFLTFTVGRIVLATVPERLGYARTVQWGSFLAACALALTLVSSLALIGFSLAGIAFSVVFPTLLAWGPRRHLEIRAQMASIAIAAAAAGGVVIPPAVGAVVGVFGAPALPPLLIAITLLLGLLALFEPGLEAVAGPTQTAVD